MGACGKRSEILSVYWFGIIKDAAKATGKRFDVRGSLFLVLIYGGLLFLLSWLLANGVLTLPFFVDLTGDLTGEIRLGIALLIVLSVLFVGNLIYVPAMTCPPKTDPGCKLVGSVRKGGRAHAQKAIFLRANHPEAEGGGSASQPGSNDTTSL